MARARNIKPALFKNEVLGVADPLYTLCFEGLWLLADRAGRLEDRPLRIRAELFPYRDGLNIENILDWLQSNGFISRYQYGNNRYIQITNFSKHQNPHKNESPSEIPEKSDSCDTSDFIGTASDSNGSAPADSLSLDSLSLDSLIPDYAPPSPTVMDFDSFWKLYPNGSAKAAAQKAWEKLNPDHSLAAEIAAGLAVHMSCAKWAEEGGKYIPHGSTWLNGRRWQDEVKPASNVVKFDRHVGLADRFVIENEREDGTHAF